VEAPRVSIDELCELTGYTRTGIRTLVRKRIVSPPHGPKNRYAVWTRTHLAEVRAWIDLKHANTRATEIGPFLHEEGIDIVEFRNRRERAIKEFGLGVG
jgi:hypothetical protein